MQCLWDEICTIFTLTKLDDEYYEALKNLSRITHLADVCLEIIERFDKEKTKINNITKVYIQNMKLKIKVRETIIKLRKYPNSLDNDSLYKLYNEYNKLISYEPDDLGELRKIIGGDFDTMFEKATKFIEWLNDAAESKFNDLHSVISTILNHYPYDINEDNKQIKWNDLEDFKYGKISKEDYLDKIKGKYYDLINANETSDFDKNIFDAILCCLNKKSYAFDRS